MSYGVLEHLENVDDLRKAISEIHRVLKKDGIAFITILNLKFLNLVYSIKNKINNNNFIRAIFNKNKIKSNFLNITIHKKNFYQILIKISLKFVRLFQRMYHLY